MLKIAAVESMGPGVALRLEGQIIGPWVEELQKVCQAAGAADRSLRLDLGDVSFVDHSGVRLLAGLRARGVRLLRCTPFVREQLRAGAERMAKA